ncbi:MAG: hypothetical protein AAB017_04980 [Nitrospirota bacterium]|mgnify:CR=1 FL=1
MKIVAVRVPEDTKKKMKEIHEDWSGYLRKVIVDRIQQEKKLQEKQSNTQKN